jgi:formylglycine-generating enzyme required for sulfatase activity
MPTSPEASAWGAEPGTVTATSFSIPAYAFDRGSNVRTRPVGTTPWTDTEPMTHCTGRYPARLEYDVDFPVSAEYAISIRYAAETPRPLELTLDRRVLGACCRDATGGWKTSQAAWETACRVFISQGKHTLALSRNSGFPHLLGLRFDSSVPFPPGWKLERPNAKRLAESVPATAAIPAAEVNTQALRLAIVDLKETFGEEYPRGNDYLRRLDALEERARNREDSSAEERAELSGNLRSLEREVLLDNPLLAFEKLLLVKRAADSLHLGLPQNWQSNASLPKTGYRDAIAVLSGLNPQGRLTVLHEPPEGRFLGDMDLEFDARRLLFSSVGENGRWQVFEIGVDGSGLRQRTGQQPDVDSYDACYLPNGKIAFTSSAYFNSVACTGDHAAVLYVMNADGTGIRQLCFDQEHDWCPTVLNSGRLLYARWEYTDTVHCHSRLLFHMNPDGTQQMEYLGANSYWPNAFFFARPIPDHPTKVVAVISGHHGVPRMGELVVFDPALGRHEAQGAVQRIPGHGKKVEAVLKDRLVDDSWPKFLNPYPLSEKYFLVASKPRPESLWGIYLVDTFDNAILIKEEPGYALLEPIPLKQTSRPPSVSENVDLARNDAIATIEDIYAGPGLKGIPRGTVKSLRVFTYHFAYQGMVGNPNTIGIDGPWDIKRVLGTVPVREDGSARFRIPANTPISVQPLDAEGKALQLMRSWMTAMPGETLQCIGCHEPRNSAPPVRTNLAMNRPPDEIKPWYGPTRGFSYRREVQPVIDRYCVGCHDGAQRTDELDVPNLRGDVMANDYSSVLSWQRNMDAGKFSVGYTQLHRFVRRPGAESDYHILEPMEFHADTTELIQLLKKGHYGVELDAEAWDRLITWIDLNCPFHGTRHEELLDPGIQRERRRELLRLYADVEDDPEAVPGPGTGIYNSGSPLEPIIREPCSVTATEIPHVPGWPFDAAQAESRQRAAGKVTRRSVDLGDGEKIDLVLIPAGEFVMGDSAGWPDEQPPCKVDIERPFWISVHEITNREYSRYDSAHDSRVESKNATQYGIQGYPVNRPEQPVVRVSWNEAIAFCGWLSKKTGRRFSLPTEAQWEYAARAGTATPFWYGELDAEFSQYANMADAKLAEFASDVWDNGKPLENPSRYDEWFPKEPRYNDGALLSVSPGSYRPNPWGLFDMHGNVAEWTRTIYRPYPYDSGDGREDATSQGRKVVRGGSWFDRPKRCTSGFRLSYLACQRVFNVGFRVVYEAEGGS